MRPHERCRCEGGRVRFPRQVLGEMAFLLPHPHLQIRHRGPDVALGPLRDLAGNGDGSAPAPGEEGREDLVFRGLEPDRLEAGLEPFGQAGHIQVGGAEERVAGFHAVEVGQEHVLGVLGAAVQFVDHLD